MPFPLHRTRRLRKADWVRQLVCEHRLHASDFVWPIFIQEGAENSPVQAMQGVERIGVKQLANVVYEAHASGIMAVALFPVIEAGKKDAYGREALNADNLICRAIAEIKHAVPAIGVVADVALDPYTSHGHDGVLNAQGEVANDKTVELLVQQALILAEAGADVIAPSDKMDGRILAIRHALEAGGYHHTLILSYAAKFASCFYSPFREAIGAPHCGLDKRSYQMDPSNNKAALQAADEEVAQGADMLMVKPAMPYLDIIAGITQRHDLPVFAYQVSGEYAMLRGLAGEDDTYFQHVMCESLIGFKRAGASAIVTYAACEIARVL